jgi:hypothetical protein
LNNWSEVLKAISPYAGLGGISIALVVLLFRSVIAKEIFPRLTKVHAYRIIRLVVLLAFFLGLAGIAASLFAPSIGTPASVGLVSPSINQPPVTNHPPPPAKDSEQPAPQRAAHNTHSRGGIVKVCSFSGGVNNGTVNQDCSH